MFIEKSQHSLAEISKKEGINSRILRLFFEKFIHSLLFQVFAIESLTKYSGSKNKNAPHDPHAPHQGVDSLFLKNTFESKFDLLKKLKKFRTNKILAPRPLRRIYITKNNNEKITLSIPSILDRATQQLVLLLLEPIIEVHSDIYSFGFRKGRNPIMAIGTLQKNLQIKPNTMKRYVDIQYIWDADINCDKINHD
jgi:retron-type reverse transcriptase